MSGRLTVYIAAPLLTDGGEDLLALAEELEMTAVVIDADHVLPDALDGAWFLTDTAPDPGSRHWSRTVVIGPRAADGRRTVTGLRTARDLRLALLELASENAPV